MTWQWAITPARALHPSTPPPLHLLPKSPLHLLLPPNTFSPGPELAISGYTYSVHVFLAAWPRSTPLASLPDDLQEGVDERKTRIARVTKHILEVKATREREQPDALDDSGRVLWVTATRWVRTAGVQASDKTLLCTHANGLHGTIYTPVLRRLLAQRQDVAEVWALDGVQHGDAAILNAGKNGIFFDWHDAISLAIYSVSSSTSCLFALGHSIGGCALALAASHHPELFSAVMLVDPMIMPSEIDRTISHPPGWVAHDGTILTIGYRSLSLYMANTLGRRTRWPSRAVAHEALAVHPLFSTWDNEVLDVYVKQALVEEEVGGEVRLKCDKIDEAAVYAETRAPLEAWSALPLLDERVSLLWIDPPAGNSVVQTREFAAAAVHRRAANSAYVVIPDGTHLAVQTHPYQVAEAVQIFLRAVDAGAVGTAHEIRLHNSKDVAPSQCKLCARL
ncbi:hypothetical protein PENSPDRAFT_759415 [Peniophora sp. CONT]|nr:hypothetical protein PENSPDRAFT_759415 [Peniophora sp. CONT]